MTENEELEITEAAEGIGLPTTISHLVSRLAALNPTQMRAKTTEDIIIFSLEDPENSGRFPNRTDVGQLRTTSSGTTYDGLLPIANRQGTVQRVVLDFDEQGQQKGRRLYINHSDDFRVLNGYDQKILADLRQALGAVFLGISVAYAGQSTAYMGSVDTLSISAQGVPIGSIQIGEQRSVGSYVGVTWQPRCQMRNMSKPADIQDNGRFRVSEEAEKFRLHQGAIGKLVVPYQCGVAYRTTPLNPIA